MLITVDKCFHNKSISQQINYLLQKGGQKSGDTPSQECFLIVREPMFFFSNEIFSIEIELTLLELFMVG